MFVRKIATPGLFFGEQNLEKITSRSRRRALYLLDMDYFQHVFFKYFQKIFLENLFWLEKTGFVFLGHRSISSVHLSAHLGGGILFCFSLLKASLETFILLHKPRRWSNFHALSRFSFNVNE